MKTPINDGIVQSDLDFNDFKATNADLSDYAGSGVSWNEASKQFDASGGAFFNLIVNVTDAPYNATGDGVTNDTAAIQAAIDDVCDAGGGTVYFPEGTYLISGALQVATNSQLVLPTVDYDHSMIYIRFLGDFANWKNQADGTIPTASNTGTIIKSNITGLGGSEPAIIGVAGDPVSFGFSNIFPVFENILFRTYDNPELGCLNMRDATHVQIKNCNFDTGTPVLGISQPTHAGAVAIVASALNNNGMVRIDDVVIFGYYTGLIPGEHAVINNVVFSLCRVAMQFDFMYHATLVGRVLCSWCPTLLKWLDTHYVRFEQLDIEHNPASWYTPVYDVDDSGNKSGGTLNWHLVTAGVGVSHSLLVNGARNLITTELYSGNAAKSVTVATLPSAPTIGNYATVTDGTGALAWGATVTGGGSTKYLVWYNGTNWTVAGK